MVLVDFGVGLLSFLIFLLMFDIWWDVIADWVFGLLFRLLRIGFVV